MIMAIRTKVRREISLMVIMESWESCLYQVAFASLLGKFQLEVSSCFRGPFRWGSLFEMRNLNLRINAFIGTEVG